MLRYLPFLVAIAAATPTCAADLEIANSAKVPLYEVYLSRIDETHWRPDMLGPSGGPLAPGAVRVLPGIEAGVYNLRIVDVDGRECELDAVTIETLARIELTDVKLTECTSSN